MAYCAWDTTRPPADALATGFRDTSAGVLAAMKERAAGRPVLLSFSCGKDSIAAWITLEEHGFEVEPFYMAQIPGMAFVEASTACAMASESMGGTASPICVYCEDRLPVNTM